MTTTEREPRRMFNIRLNDLERDMLREIAAREECTAGELFRSWIRVQHAKLIGDRPKQKKTAKK